MEFILASGSPRRRQLLEQIGLRDFTVRPTDADESLPAGIHPGEAVERLSARKGMAARLQAGPEALILAADTVVALDGAILGKPGGREEAVSMLTALSGRTHQVYTGVTLIRGEQILTEHFEGGRTVADTRTMAIQISEGLFQRLKEHLAKEQISQKQFIIGLIEKALEEAERAEETEE